MQSMRLPKFGYAGWKDTAPRIQSILAIAKANVESAWPPNRTTALGKSRSKHWICNSKLNPLRDDCANSYSVVRCLWRRPRKFGTHAGQMVDLVTAEKPITRSCLQHSPLVSNVVWLVFFDYRRKGSSAKCNSQLTKADTPARVDFVLLRYIRCYVFVWPLKKYCFRLGCKR